jgi:hypothetical protein
MPWLRVPQDFEIIKDEVNDPAGSVGEENVSVFSGNMST